MESNSETFFILFILFSSVSLFLGIWLGILFLLSYFGGWNKLYQSYKFPERPQKPFLTKSFQSIQLGLSNYNGIMTLFYHPEGLGMSVMILFRFKHPKILIPWKDIQLKEKSKSIFTWNKLEIGNPMIASIAVNNKTLEQIRPYLGKQEVAEERW